MPPKRKRAERSHEGSRPSPHRPFDTTLGQRDRDNVDSPGRRSGRNFRRNDRRDSHQSHAGQPSNNQNASSPTVARPQSSLAHPAASSTSAERHRASATVAPTPAPPSPVASSYSYDNLTGDKISSWASFSKQVIEHGVQSREDVDIVELSSLFQEFIQSVIDNRLNPTDAGNCIKEIIGPESEEVIKDAFSFEPHKLFLDTLSTVVEQWPVLQADQQIPKLREFLIATNVAPSLMRQILDGHLLQKLGLIRDTFHKIGVRQATNLLYRQANYNLLREESEGYSKLLTELFTSFSEVASWEIPSTEMARDAFERIKALIGTFDLDVGRVLDVTLDVCATSLVKASKFFVKLLRVSSWWPRSRFSPNAIFSGGLPPWAVPDGPGLDHAAILDLKRQRDIQFWNRARESHIQAWFELGGRQVTEEDLQRPGFLDNATEAEAEATRAWMDVTKTLPPQGNRVAAQLLGFKLRFYVSDFRDGEVLPANLLYLAALLIRIGFISIVDLYPHLWPKDENMEEFRNEKMKEVELEERKKRGGGQPNALLLAGALKDDEAPFGASQSRAAAKPAADSNVKTAEAAEKNTVPKPMEQKGALVTSLLTIGAIPEALFMLGLWPWLTEAFPDIADRINRILEISIDKVYQESRPVATRPVDCPAKKFPNIDQSDAPKGTVKLIDFPAKKPMRWPYPDGRAGPGDQPYRFYWEEWADDVPICQTLDDLSTLCDTFLKISGPNIGKSSSLYAKLLMIGEKSLATDKSQKNLDRWQDMLTRVLVPALSATEGSANASESLWSLLKQYPSTTRYAIYAEWFEGATSRIPAMKLLFAHTKSATQGVMKRVSNKNLTDSAKSLAKASHSCPGIVCRVALDQISSYANLTDAMVECAKYFTDLSKDVLVWTLLGALGSNQRSRTQASYILSVSAWLQALSGFAGKVFRRYKELDVTPILQYVNNQLFHGNSTDLIILEGLILSMGGIVKTSDITDEQVGAMSGMALLQRHTLVSMRDNRFNSTHSSKRLMQALVDSRLAGRLLVNISQFRQSASFRIADDGAHIKFLSSMMDNTHQILTQYLDLLRTNLTPDEFDKIIPSISQLMIDFGLDASLAFMIGRESLAAHIFTKASSGAATAAKAKESLAASEKASEEQDGDVSMGENTPEVTNGVHPTSTATSASPAPDQKSEPQTVSGNFDVVQPVIESIRATTPSAVWEKTSAEFFVIFWALQLGDLVVPWDSYSIASDRCKDQWRNLIADRSDMSRSGVAQREAKKTETKTDMENLAKEAKQQFERQAKTKVHITQRMSSWFTGNVERLNGVSDTIIEQCLFPRLIVSKIDTEYCYALIKQLHDIACPNFRLRILYDRLFNANRLRLMIFTCTVREAELLGRFFHHVLRDLAKWHQDSAAYEKEAIGKNDKKLPHGRLGFADKFNDEGQPTSHIPHEEFRSILFGWHRSLNVALKSCLAGTEWMHIRNAVSFLSATAQFFPSIDFMGEQLKSQLVTIAGREQNAREDLAVLANGVISVLTRMKPKWVKVQAFRTNLAAQEEAQNTKPGQSVKATGPANLRPDAPTFQPKPISNEDEDGEVKDARGKVQSSNPQAPVQRSSSQQDVSKNPPPRAPSRQEQAKPAQARTNSEPTATAANSSAQNAPSKQPIPSAPGSNRSTLKAPNLPARPPGPIPENLPKGRHGVPMQADRRDTRDHRDARGLPRDSRETRDSRDNRQGDVGRQDRGRDLPGSDRRGQETTTRDSGRLSDMDRPMRPEPLASRRDHSQPAMENGSSNETPSRIKSKTPDAGRGARDTASSSNAPASQTSEPAMNPARAALIQGEPELSDRHDRPDRSRQSDHDRRRSGRQPETTPSDQTNPRRAAQLTDLPPPRQPREEPRETRERGTPRNHSPRRSGRHGANAPPDPGREEHDRSHHEPRPHGRDSRDPRGDGHPALHPKDDRYAADNTKEAFLGAVARGQDADRPRQDDNYGRLNPIQSVVSDAPSAPSGPRIRGAQRTRGGTVNTPPRPHPADNYGAGSDDRQPPTGPASGRSRQHQGPAPAPASTPSNAGNAPDRARQVPSSAPAPPSRPSEASSGVHPDRLAQISDTPGQGGGGHGHPHGGPTTSTPDRQATSTPTNQRDPPAKPHDTSTPGLPAPTGPAGNERRRHREGRKQLEGINSIIQQANSTLDSGRGSIRGRASRQNLENSDAQVLTGGSPVTSAHERPNPMHSQERESATGGDDRGRSGDRDRSHRERDRGERSGRNSRRHSPNRSDRNRERERSPTREREGKDSRDYRARRPEAAGHASSGRDDRERESRRSGRDASGTGPREPRASAAQSSSNMEPLGTREPRHRHHDRGGDAGSGGAKNEEWGGNMRSNSIRGGPREGGSGGGLRAGGDDRREHRDDRGRKRRSEDASGFTSEKRQRR